MNIGDKLPEEKTEVIYGAENIINATLEQWSHLKHFADICTDSNGPSMFVIPGHPITEAYRQLKDRGIKLRFIAEINKANIQSCKELMKTCELRHLDEIKGNFGLGDGLYYRASAKTTESSPPPLLISSTLRALVEQQQYFFDMLWRKAIPVKKRIREIEEGSKREFIETIQDPKEILDIVHKIVSSSTEEIQLIISSKELLQLFESKIDLTNLLNVQLKENNRVQIMIHGKGLNDVSESKIPDNQFHSLYELTKDYKDQLEIQYIISDIYERLNVFISDRKTIAVIEFNKLTKDKMISIDDDDDVFDRLGLATYSNSESTVSSYATIFDTLWIRSSLKRDNEPL